MANLYRIGKNSVVLTGTVWNNLEADNLGNVTRIIDKKRMLDLIFEFEADGLGKGDSYPKSVDIIVPCDGDATRKDEIVRILKNVKIEILGRFHIESDRPKILVESIRCGDETVATNP